MAMPLGESPTRGGVESEGLEFMAIPPATTPKVFAVSRNQSLRQNGDSIFHFAKRPTTACGDFFSSYQNIGGLE
jgi:hypothetical protein